MNCWKKLKTTTFNDKIDKVRLIKLSGFFSMLSLLGFFPPENPQRMS